jgi:hypothetical protein
MNIELQITWHCLNIGYTSIDAHIDWRIDIVEYDKLGSIIENDRQSNTIQVSASARRNKLCFDIEGRQASRVIIIATGGW